MTSFEIKRYSQGAKTRLFVLKSSENRVPARPILTRFSTKMIKAIHDWFVCFSRARIRFIPYPFLPAQICLQLDCVPPALRGVPLPGPRSVRGLGRQFYLTFLQPIAYWHVCSKFYRPKLFQR